MSHDKKDDGAALTPEQVVQRGDVFNWPEWRIDQGAFEFEDMAQTVQAAQARQLAQIADNLDRLNGFMQRLTDVAETALSVFINRGQR